MEDYVIEKWDEVSISEEFERCCQEVAAGEYVHRLLLRGHKLIYVSLRWGSDGGKTLMRIFRRLRAPGALV